MGNSPLVAHTNISPNCRVRTSEIDTVTIHCVVGQCTAESLGAWFAKPSTAASSNYGVDKDGRIGLYVPEDYRSWCSSNVPNDDRAITIEVASDTYAPFRITNEAYHGLVDLLVDICQRRPKIGRLRWLGNSSLIGQVELQNMTVHRWFASKSCPGDYLFGLHGQIANEVNTRLDALEGVIPEIQEDVIMTDERFEQYWEALRKELQDNDCSDYSLAARQWAIETGLFQGNGTTIDGEANYMWEDFLTREQFATVLYRFAQTLGEA